MATQVFDTASLLSYLRDESGAELLQSFLEKASRKDVPILMTDVNYADLKHSVLRDNGKEAWVDVVASLDSLPIEFVPTTRQLADGAAEIMASYGIDISQSFAAALARERRADLVASDPKLKGMEKMLKIILLK